jgi:HTH-type transcriptional regulator / antitoxin HipB
MSDLKKYITKRKKTDPEFAKNYESGFEEFKIGIMIRMARERSGFTQEELANKINSTKSSISRIENHSEDIKLSTLIKVAKALGRNVSVKIL